MNDFHMDSSGSWTLGILVWLPIAVLLWLGCVILAAWFFATAPEKGRSGRLDSLAGGWGSLLGAACFVVAILWGFYPYKAEYHQYREVDGTIERIDNRLIGSGKSTSTKFAVRFEGSALQFGCDDTRCSQAESGDHLVLDCKRAFQYAGTDGYDCRFVSLEAGNGVG